MSLEPFEYVVILTSLILGLGIAQILTSAADIFSNLKNVNVGYTHSLLIIVVFNLHIQEWWESYQMAYVVKEWTMPMVLFILIYPISLFTLARMIFPTGLRETETDLDAYYYDQWPWFFIVFLLVPAISFLQNVLIGGYGLETQVPHYLLTSVILVFLIFRIRNKWAHIGFLTVQIISWIIWLAQEDRVL
ncbi:MAG: hypothetical protein ACFHWX_22960 [Bacteroidota bacterium]